MSDATILLVDDDPVLSQVLRRVLTQQGYTVVEAGSVSDGLERARQHRPQLGLIDLGLPDGDGVELARRLVQEVGAMPLILMTASPLRLRDEPELTQGFAHVLTKPFNYDELRQVLKRALGSAQTAVNPTGRPHQKKEIPAKAAALVPGMEMPPRFPEDPRRTAEISKPGSDDLAETSLVTATRTARSRRIRTLAIGLVLLVVGGVITLLTISGRARSSGASNAPAEAKRPAKPRVVVELVEGVPHTIRIPENVRSGLAIQKSFVAQPPTQGRPLIMPGSTSLDPARVMRVKSRFNAQVVEIGEVVDTTQRSPAGETIMRGLRPGDKVRKGDVLAVVWSIDVGGKKSDLVDALVQLQLDDKRLRAREELFKKGSLPEDTLNQTRRDVVSDRNAQGRAERTLRTWNVPEREIQAVYEEADLVSARRGKRDPEKERLWARSELTAPRDGTIVEYNVSVGEYIADNTINLFTIAEVDRLQVLANPPEDLLPELLSLKPEQMRWSLQMVGAQAMDGPIEEIGYLIDANQHTAVVKGYINNPQGRLRAGQYVSALVNLPPPPDVLEVPLTALAEDGKQSFVFVQPDPSQPIYTMRRVRVTHRFEKTALVRSRLTVDEQALTPEEKILGLQGLEPLKRGERILPTGVLELRAALEDMESKAAKKHY
jgi:cobalt-zinc-cadmium efflux system membrane fusion protein